LVVMIGLSTAIIHFTNSLVTIGLSKDDDVILLNDYTKIGSI